MTSQELTLFFAYNLLKLHKKALQSCVRTRRWQTKNLEKFQKNQREYYSANRESRLKAKREYDRTPGGMKARRDWQRQEEENNPNFRLRKRISTRIYDALKSRASKSAKTEILLGCSVSHLKAWLEFWMQPGMTWENYGLWHVDHKKPCASFDLTKPEQQRACFNYRNLQPLWAHENLSKGAR